MFEIGTIDTRPKWVNDEPTQTWVQVCPIEQRVHVRQLASGVAAVVRATNIDCWFRVHHYPHEEDARQALVDNMGLVHTIAAGSLIRRDGNGMPYLWLDPDAEWAVAEVTQALRELPPYYWAVHTRAYLQRGFSSTMALIVKYGERYGAIKWLAQRIAEKANREHIVLSTDPIQILGEKLEEHDHLEVVRKRWNNTRRGVR